jgi:hypothetical protein
MRRLASLGAGLVLALSAQSALAQATPPCTPAPPPPAAPMMSIIPLSNGVATYCVSDYGWSDTWFVGSSPAAYDPRFDVL